MFKTTQRLLDDIVQTSEQQARELRSDLEGLEARHGELGRRFKLLYAGRCCASFNQSSDVGMLISWE